METAICAKNVSLSFASPKEKFASLKAFILAFLSGKVKRKRFLAVNNVSFEIKKGEVVGLIGRNGAGKSTLLKLVSGIARPTSGDISVNGVVAPLLALGNGLDRELTGRENIYLNGAILGYRKEFLEANEQKIIEFAELEDFIDAPVRTYSSGMTMRLAFAIATAAPPEILILDEVLAVGDAAFQAKCHERIKGIINSGATVFIVSHSIENIKKMCTRAIWLQKGSVVADGPSKEICEAYTLSLKPEEAMAYARKSNPRLPALSSKFAGTVFASSGVDVIKAALPNANVVTSLPETDVSIDACIASGEIASPTNQLVVNVAIGRKLPLFVATDGFIRSVTLEKADLPDKFWKPCSIMLSAASLHFDPTGESDVERLLNDPSFSLNENRKMTVRSIIDKIVANKIDKFNFRPRVLSQALERSSGKIIIVEDQDFRDKTVTRCHEDEKTFETMLEDAVRDNPDATVWLKLRPGATLRSQKGYYDKVEGSGRIVRIEEQYNPYSLLGHVDAVYTCSSRLGLMALLAGKKVVVYGMPFYAGWGLTEDKRSNERRKIKRTLEEVFYAYALANTIWIDPLSGRSCELGECLDSLVQLRDEFDGYNSN